MAGQKTSFDATYFTPMRVYRRRVTAPEIDPSLVEPTIRLDQDSDKPIQRGGLRTLASSSRGYNGRLAVYVCIEPTSGSSESEEAESDAVVSVWVLATPQKVGYDEAEEDFSGSWCHVDSITTRRNGLFLITDVPAAAYKLTIDEVPVGYSVTVVEQHTE